MSELLEANPRLNLNEKMGPVGSLPLVEAAELNDPEMLNLLLAYGADLNGTDASGETAYSVVTSAIKNSSSPERYDPILKFLEEKKHSIKL